jgi:hypothetical protein
LSSCFLVDERREVGAGSGEFKARAGGVEVPWPSMQFLKVMRRSRASIVGHSPG